MQQDRVILHSDLNGFFASVEMVLDPRLRKYPVAVCGSTEDRHGIVLAKNELAKKHGIKTGMVNFEAKKRCPDLVMCLPKYEMYVKFSRLTREIYERYTNLVEPFGMDECWLDVTDNAKHRSGYEIADEIRKTVKDELGLTVSIGVSFSKVFAKLGSDMKKPDAVTVISRDNFKDLVWKLPLGDLLYAGRATTDKLSRLGINTIGALANYPRGAIHALLGANGEMLWNFANGLDTSAVMPTDHKNEIKSIGHGVTLKADLVNTFEVRCVVLELAQEISGRLRENGLFAVALELDVRQNNLNHVVYRTRPQTPTQSAKEICSVLMKSFASRYNWDLPIRSLTVRASQLCDESGTVFQTDLFSDLEKIEKQKRIDDAVWDVRDRFGEKKIIPASLLLNKKMPGSSTKESVLPGMMYK